MKNPEEEIRQKIQGIVAEQLGIAEEEILPSSAFVEDLGADSLDVVEVVMAVEEEFEIEIAETEVDNFECVKDLVDFVTARVE